MRPTLAFFITLFGFSLLTNPALAVTVSISEIPSSIGSDPFEFKAKVEGAQAGTNYLRVLFSEPGKKNYFGYSFNGTDFYNGSNHTLHFPIPIDSSGIWQGTVKGKIDTNDSSFKGGGNYALKVRRYTTSGSNPLDSSEVSVLINYSTIPSPSPSGSSTPIPTYTSTIPNTIFVVENIPSSVSSNESFIVKVNLINPNAKNTKFFIKGAFVKKGESNYFGFTKVSGSNVKNSSSYNNQKEITTDSNGQWIGDLEVQPDSGDTGFKGTGEYGFKVGRYTQSGSGPTWSNEGTITINEVSSPTSSGSENNSTGSNPSPNESLNNSSSTNDGNFENSIVTINKEEVKKDIKIPEIKGASDKKEDVIVAGEKTNISGYNFIYMILGFIILASAGGIFFYKFKKQGGLRKIDI